MIRTLRERGAEVVYLGNRFPNEVAEAALQEAADLIVSHPLGKPPDCCRRSSRPWSAAACGAGARGRGDRAAGGAGLEGLGVADVSAPAAR